MIILSWLFVYVLFVVVVVVGAQNSRACLVPAENTVAGDRCLASSYINVESCQICISGCLRRSPAPADTPASVGRSQPAVERLQCRHRVGRQVTHAGRERSRQRGAAGAGRIVREGVCGAAVFVLREDVGDDLDGAVAQRQLAVPVGRCTGVRPDDEQPSLEVRADADVDDPQRQRVVVVRVGLGHLGQAALDFRLHCLRHPKVNLDKQQLQMLRAAGHVAYLLGQEGEVWEEGRHAAVGLEVRVHERDLDHLV
mmetsp:Transcript_9719/g.24706  ORF Transcript_9719/g.24706 Transcript_9719/m.24706 type:complete len:254 (+) Transcript_9719:183-944(+)